MVINLYLVYDLKNKASPSTARCRQLYSLYYSGGGSEIIELGVVQLPTASITDDCFNDLAFVSDGFVFNSKTQLDHVLIDA